MTEHTDRDSPGLPTPDLWAAADEDYQAGRVMRLIVTNSHAKASVHVTLTWLTQWRRLPLSMEQRTAIRTAASQIHRGVIHPMLGQRQLPPEYPDSWIASPYPEVTVTWQAHWQDPHLPVLLTLDKADQPIYEGEH